ncbi:hypothetical protein ACIP92_25795 [Bacillus cereus]|uniref:hypothetical protein n=1 Tax=Bacillus cereus TaxID=1396 RepID=UPI0038169F6F
MNYLYVLHSTDPPPYYWNYGQDYRQQLTSDVLLQNPQIYNGLKVKSPRDINIYLIDKGTRRLIHGPSVYLSLFNQSPSHEVLDLERIPLGNPIVQGTHLFRSDEPSKRGIASPQVYRKYDFTEKVQIHPQSIIDGIPDGSEVN